MIAIADRPVEIDISKKQKIGHRLYLGLLVDLMGNITVSEAVVTFQYMETLSKPK